MSIKELEREYSAVAASLSERVKFLKSIPLSQERKESVYLKHRIDSLKYDISECRRCAKILRNYCKRESLK